MITKLKTKENYSKYINDIVNIESNAYGNFGWSKEVFIKEFNNDGAFYLISTDSAEHIVYGYIGAWKIFYEGHITTLVISPLYRNKHIADILLYTLIINFIEQKIKWLTLEVKASNIPAINLYEKFKFKQLGLRKNYYQDTNEDALILWSEDITTNEYRKSLDEIYNSFSTYISTDK